MTTNFFGRYEVIEQIGSGGMADVYRAKDPMLGRVVAIKAPRIDDQDGDKKVELLRLFTQEAQAVARLKADAIVGVYDFGDENGRPYLVMKYMPNGSLADRLDKGTLTIEEALPIIRRVAEALDHAHGERFIHHDVKPGNILFDEEDQAYLSDFGIARFIAAIAPDDDEKTGKRVSKVRGTAAYMSPEQAIARGVTTHSDVYSLGIVAHEMLTGSPSLQAANDDVPVGVVHANAPTPLPVAVKKVIDRAVTMEPTSRYASASEFARALEAAAADPRVEADDVPIIVLPATPNDAIEDASPEKPKVTKPVRRLLIPLVATLLALGLWALSAFWPTPPVPGTLPSPTDMVELPIVIISPSPTLGHTNTSPTGASPTGASPTGASPTGASPTISTTGTEPNTAAPTLTSTSAPPIPTPPVQLVAETIANVFTRSGPGLAYPVDGSLRRGQIVPVIARDLTRLWYLVQVATDRVAWVFADYIVGAGGTDLSSVGPAATIPPTLTPAPTLTPNLGPTSTPVSDPPANASPTATLPSPATTLPSPTATLPCTGYCPPED